MKLDLPTVNDLNTDLLEITQASVKVAGLLDARTGGPELADALESLATATNRFTRKMKVLITEGKLS